MQIVVKGDVKRMQRDLDRLRKQDQPRAIATALNKTRPSLRTQIVRAVTKAIGARRQAPIRRRVVFGRAAKPKRLWTVIRLLTWKPFGIEVLFPVRQTGSRWPHVPGGVNAAGGGYHGGAWIQPGTFEPKLKGMVFRRSPGKMKSKSKQKISRVTFKWSASDAIAAAKKANATHGRRIFRDKLKDAIRFYVSKGMRKP